MEANRGATSFSERAGRDGDRQISDGNGHFGYSGKGVEQVIDAQTHDRWRIVRQILLVPAVVMALMTAAPPAGAPRVTGPTGVAGSARTVSGRHGACRPAWPQSGLSQVPVEVGRALQVQKGLDRIRTRRVQADLSECRVGAERQ